MKSGGSSPPIVLGVLSVAPTDAATGVAISTTVTVTFDRDIDFTTVNTTSFSVTDTFGAIAGNPITNPSPDSIRFTPLVDLRGNEDHTITLTNALKDVTGLFFLAPTTFTFRTGAVPDITAPPTPATLTGITQDNALTLTLTWTAAADDVDPPSSILYRIYRAPSAGTQNFSSPTGSTSPGVTTFTDTGLTENTPYFYVVRAEDSSGNEETTGSNELSQTTPLKRDWTTEVFPLINGTGSFPITCTTAPCHGGGIGGLTMNGADSVATRLALVNVPSTTVPCSSLDRIEPFESQNSALFRRISGTCGVQMPFGGPDYFTDAGQAANYDIIRDWIDEGAEP